MPNIEAFDLSPSFSLSFLAWRVKFLSVKYNFEFQGKIYCKNGNFGNIWQITSGVSDCYIN